MFRRSTMSELANVPVVDEPLPLCENVSQTISLPLRLANLAVVVLPFLGLVALGISLWGWGFRWVDCGLLLGMYMVTAVGITVGYHRLFTHRAFETNRVVQFLLAIFGSMAVEGPLLKWVALHRRHHQYSDTHEDPHSPHEQGDGFLGLLRGIWHSHADGKLDGSRDRSAVGRLGANIPGPSCNVEHQLDLSSVGPPTIPDWRPQPKQFRFRRPRVWRGVA
jgi:fatty-acid desaturase